jgi:hypothetical protein
MTTPAAPKKKKKKNKYKAFIISGILIVIVTVVYAYVINQFNSEGKWDYTGTFGDSFGGLTAAFTGLAFAGVEISLILITPFRFKATTLFRDKLTTSFRGKLTT